MSSNMQTTATPPQNQSAAAIPNLAEQQRLFQCSTCKRSFGRADHLTRHVRAHTRQKPYVCPVCSKGFARIDLLKRHVTNHDSNSAKKRQRREITRDTRVVQACEACSQSHLRCEDDKPCARCRKKNIPCQVPDAPTNDEGELDAVHAAQDLLDLSNGADFSPPLPIPESGSHQPSTPRTRAFETNMSLDHRLPPALTGHIDHSAHQPGTGGGDRSMTTPNSMLPPSPPGDGLLGFFDSALPHFVNTPSIDLFLPDCFRNMPPFESYLSGQATPRGLMDLSFDLDIGLTDLDLGLLDQYNFQAPFAAETPSTDARETLEHLSETDSVPVRTEAFKQSIWRYLPQRNRDHGAAEQPNLAFTDSENDSRRSSMTQRRAIPEKLDRVGRDRLLALVLGTCSPANVKRIASAFPSIELLDGLIQYFLTSPTIDAQSWFHLPTFSPSNTSPELLACIVAAGAASTPDTPLRKLGFALHEASRNEQAKAFEEDNSAIRDLHHVRNLCLQLEVGMWSGISRKMEISESFLQPLITMLRRGSRFRQSTWKEIHPNRDDHGPELEKKWLEWSHQESYLRLVYRAFELDRQSSMALLKPPLISYAEMQLPLPNPNALWHANSAAAWKSAFLNTTPHVGKRPSAIDCFLDLEHLSHHDSACKTYLYMMWGLVWEYRQVSTLTAKSQLKANNSLIVSSRYQELVKQLEDFQVSSPSLSKSHEITMELMLLHLHAPLDDTQLFAGIEGQEEARYAYYGLREWTKTVSARQALWHAGQILRAAESLPKVLLCNFNAVAVYHAGLILWAYGFLNRTSSSDPTSGEAPQSVVVLNGDDSLSARRFITLDRGIPSIRNPGSQNTTRLSDVAGVMENLACLLRGLSNAAESSRPPLVGNLVQLLEGLRSATK
ncbi:C6 transcription factor-like protein RegA [Lentithecium fluviatile CBS 122367]|uniref:C6 transcription factor-like protein RegA n=1 Tax=Lentithecium fluviatile CBS 122367 TaxID=1168545 RepID=A0A6G1JC02_9PLEO|nr:C6 transcription factor-like protein RegA [Lentithecium fluviatile CBS 122367]